MKSAVSLRVGARHVLVTALVALIACDKPRAAGTASRQAPSGRPPSGLGTPSAGYDFAYDAAGRLAVVNAPNGEGAQYVYDPAGNILAIRRYTAGTLAIVGFSPTQGTTGQLVTVSGVGFSAVAAENVLQLNGTPATVISSTSAQLTFAVPAGATSGMITATVAGSSATSTDAFLVAAPVSISSFSPNFGQPGTPVFISGQGFEPVAINDLVTFGQTRAPAAAATATALQAAVPTSARTGQIVVQALNGSAVSAANFVIIPSVLTASNVLSAADVDSGGSVAVNIDTAGKSRLFDFAGTGGMGATLYVTGVTYPGSTTIQVFNPQGASYTVNTVTAGATSKIDLGVLPVSGNYTVAVQPAAASTGTLNLQVFIDSNAPLPPDGAPVSLTAATGQNISYTFTGTVADLLSLAAPQVSTTPAGTNVSFQVLKPDGSGLTTCIFISPSSCALPVLPASGTYLIRVTPSATASFATTVLLSKAVAGTMIAGTPMQFTSSRAGLIARYSFTATAGQNLALEWQGQPSWPNQLSLTIFGPSGNAVLFVTRGTSSIPSWDSKIDLVNLSAGTYIFVLQSTGAATGATSSLTLWPEATAAVPVDGASVALTGVTGQNGRYTFAGTAGDFLSVAVTQLSTAPANANVSFQVLTSDGAVLATCVFSSPSSCALPVLPATGTYSIRVIPDGTASFATTVLLSEAAAGTLTADGTPMQFTSSRAGLIARYSLQRPRDRTSRSNGKASRRGSINCL
jgi:YD repeat-containing protein